MRELELQHTDEFILIVEDSAVDFEIAVRCMRKAGFTQRFEHCKNGDEAIDFLIYGGESRAEENYPGLILLDLNLPGTDGKTVLKMVKTHEGLRKIPLIVLTTSSHEQDIDYCYAMGANSFVRKPMAPDDFVTMASALKLFWYDWASRPGKAYFSTE